MAEAEQACKLAKSCAEAQSRHILPGSQWLARSVLRGQAVQDTLCPDLQWTDTRLTALASWKSHLVYYVCMSKFVACRSARMALPGQQY